MKLENCYKKTVKYLFDFRRIDFLKIQKKAQTIKEKTDKFNYIKINNIYSLKRCHKESEKTSHKLGEGYNTCNN